MSKPSTIQDLLASGIVSKRDLDRMACRLFTSGREMTTLIDGYVVRVPDFAELPETCQAFIRKALVFATVTNILDAGEMKMEEQDLPVMDEDLYTQEDVDAHGTRDRAEAKAFDSIVDDHFGKVDG